MKMNIKWTRTLFVAGLLLAACAKSAEPPAKVQPATLEEIEGSDIQRVVLTEKAAERIGLQTATLREAQVEESQTVVGEILENGGGASAKPGTLLLRAYVDEAEFALIARDRPARVLSLNGDDGEDYDGEEEDGWLAEPDEAEGLDDDEEETKLGPAVYYVLAGESAGLVPGDRVFVKIPLSRSGTQEKVIPYTALIYDAEGGTWVYVKDAEALSFVRQRVTVDFIEEDLVYLRDGPAVDTEVVTQGGDELFGAETGVSK